MPSVIFFPLLHSIFYDMTYVYDKFMSFNLCEIEKGDEIRWGSRLLESVHVYIELSS